MTTLKIRRTIGRSVAVPAFMLLPVLVLMMTAALHAEDVVSHWNQVMMEVSGKDGVGPVRGTREFAIVHTAVFDSLNGIQRKYTPIHANFPKPTGASVQAAVIESAYRTLLALHPAQQRTLNAERKASLAKLHASPEAIKMGRQYGALVAADILAWRGTDGFEPQPPPYWGSEDIGKWRPTPPNLLPGVFPQFATMVTWSIRSPNQFRPAGPPSLTSNEYAADFNEVKTWGSAGDSPRTPDQTVLALFWAGNTPAFWNQIARSVIDRHPRLTLIRKARIFALLNITMADALIACWDAKYHYEFWRPITAITLANLDGNPDTDVDSSWTPLLGGTPAHPEYISGRSTVSGSAASVLAHFFGDNTKFLIDSEQVPGVWRAFPSFSAALLEIHDARVFGGIHFRTACLPGSAVGTKVARFVMAHSIRPI